MDKIRKALDLARLERTLPGESSFTAEAPHAAVAGVSPLRMLPTSIVYTHTRVFSPSADALEDNRIMCPASAYPGAAAFRMLRTQVLQRMNGHGWRTLAVFSPGADDGKTTTAINLAINLASDHHHTVLLVDFDFRHPALAAKFGLAPEFGVDDALCGGAKI